MCPSFSFGTSFSKHFSSLPKVFSTVYRCPMQSMGYMSMLAFVDSHLVPGCQPLPINNLPSLLVYLITPGSIATFLTQISLPQSSVGCWMYYHSICIITCHQTMYFLRAFYAEVRSVTVVPVINELCAVINKINIVLLWLLI